MNHTRTFDIEISLGDLPFSVPAGVIAQELLDEAYEHLEDAGIDEEVVFSVTATGTWSDSDPQQGLSGLYELEYLGAMRVFIEGKEVFEDEHQPLFDLIGVLEEYIEQHIKSQEIESYEDDNYPMSDE